MTHGRLSVLSLFAMCIGLALLPIRGSASNEPAPTLEQGYHDMYNLDFDHAHQVFQQWQQLKPDDPLGPVSDAAAYLFSEFDRLHILEVELFVDNSRFENRSKPSSDLKVKQAFNSEITKAQRLIDAALARSPQDANALFANVLLLGLQGDYVAMIEKHDLRGLSYIKHGRAVAQKLLATRPNCYDAYLAIGVENYLLSLKPAPVRWILQLGGAETDKDTGLDKLRLVADRGHYLMPYARLLLAVAALRDHDQERARALLEDLSRQFPHNHLYSQELARLNSHP